MTDRTCAIDAASRGRASPRCRRSRCTCTSRGACASARTATSTRTRRAATLPEDAYVDALIADLELALPSIWGRRVVTRVHRRRHAEPVLARRRSTACSPASARACRSRPTPRSRWKPIPAPSSASNSPASARRASTGCRSASRASMPRTCARSAASTTTTRRARAAEAALAIFDNVNLDLMYALPGQTRREALADVAAALAFAPPHLSFYHLTLEPNTLFHRHPPPLPDDDAAADIEDAVARDARRRRLRHYETSAYARPGRECRHNLNYWRFGDYLGIGAGAHSKLSLPGPRSCAQMRWKQPKQYLERASRRRAAAGRDRGRPRRRRLRVHAERAAPHRRRAGVALRRAHRVSAGARRARARGRDGARPARARPGDASGRRRSAGGS